jgi:hypothetical protein
MPAFYHAKSPAYENTHSALACTPVVRGAQAACVVHRPFQCQWWCFLFSLPRTRAEGEVELAEHKSMK